MTRKFITTGLVCLILISFISSSQAQDTSKKIRVGVYDNRAIAIAYFGSSYNPLVEKQLEFQRAKQVGDSVLIKELEEWGPRFQRKVHFQGFCKVPVDDLLSFVKDKLSDVAKEANVDLIGWSPSYANANVETVDITNQLVALYDPNPKILEEVKAIRNVEPTELCDITPVDYSKKK